MVDAKDALLVLADGRVFPGRRFGAPAGGTGEVVFHTGMTGYQEILSDPSYHGQMVVMTCPHIGNTGINGEDNESRRFFAAGLIVRDVCEVPSNWRHRESLPDALAQRDVAGLSGVDTRALTRHLRDHGAQAGAVVAHDADVAQVAAELRARPSMAGMDFARVVTAEHAYDWSEGLPDFFYGSFDVPDRSLGAGRKVAVLDCGVKHNILRWLVACGFTVRVFPAHTKAAEILEWGAHGLLSSNGPGDPEPVTYAVETLRDLIGRIPVFGICLGHQLLALALGGKTYKLKFGHHGANHPVQDLRTGKVEITSQNHGFCVDMESLKCADVEVTHINLNDRTVEGFRHRSLPVAAIQYHPEAAPGPHDSGSLFTDFLHQVRTHRDAR